MCLIQFTTSFRKKTLWVADKRVELYGIRLDSVDISLTIQWYHQIPSISGLYLFYILYCDNTNQVQRHTQLLYGNISMTQISGIVERHTSAINKSTSPSDFLYGDDLQWKLNGGK